MRKPMLTYEMVEQATEMKSHGMTNIDICRALGFSETAWYNWLQKPNTKVKQALVEGIKKAEAEYKDTLLSTIMATATREKNPQWTAAAWLLERKYPDEFAQTTRRDDTGAAEVPCIVLGVKAKKAANKAPEVEVSEAKALIGEGEEDNGDD